MNEGNNYEGNYERRGCAEGFGNTPDGFFMVVTEDQRTGYSPR